MRLRIRRCMITTTAFACALSSSGLPMYLMNEAVASPIVIAHRGASGVRPERHAGSV